MLSFGIVVGYVSTNINEVHQYYSFFQIIAFRCNAKFLWKRIPAAVKTEYPELGKVWAVGQALWKRDPESVFLALQAHDWSDNIDEIMNGVKGTTTYLGWDKPTTMIYKYWS